MALAAASVATRLALLLIRPLWFDEIFTAWAARLPLRDLMQALRVDSGPPGFYVVEKPLAWLVARGFLDDRLLRLPSFLAMGLLFAAARALQRGPARSTLVTLLASSVLVNLYAGEARAYALLALLCFAVFLLASTGAETPKRLALAALVTAAALYTHYLAIFAVGALLLLTAAGRRWRSCAAVACGAALFAPWVPVFLAQPPAAVAWMREAPSGTIAGFLSALGGVGRVPAPFGPPAPHALFLAAAAAGGVLLVLLAARARRDRAVLDATVFVLLVFTGAIATGSRTPIAFAGRTEMAVLPVWIWAVARASEGSRPVRWVSAAAFALAMIATFGLLLAPHPPSPLSEVTQSLARVAERRDIVLAGTTFYLPARLAAERGELAAAVQPLPAELSRHPGWFIASPPGAEEERLVARAAAGVPPGGRLFVVLAPAYETAGLRAALGSSKGRARDLLRADGALVILWTPDPGAPQASPAAAGRTPPPGA